MYVRIEKSFRIFLYFYKYSYIIQEVGSIEVGESFGSPRFVENMESITIVVVMLFTLTFTAVYGIRNEMRFDARMGRVLLGIYLLFIFAVTLEELVFNEFGEGNEGPVGLNASILSIYGVRYAQVGRSRRPQKTWYPECVILKKSVHETIERTAAAITTIYDIRPETRRCV